MIFIHIPRILFIFLALGLTLGCKDKSNSTPSSKGEIPVFNIPNTEEEVKEKFENGRHKNSVFINKDTKEKVAEVSFHENGQPYTKRNFKDGQMEGESWSYYKNGQPWSVNTFKNGVYHGKYKTWHENGQVNIEGQYVDGKENGDWLTFYPNGQINTRGIYNMGKKIGVWSSYSESGELLKEQDFTKD